LTIQRTQKYKGYMLCKNDILGVDYDILKEVSYQFTRLGTNQLLLLMKICKPCMKRFLYPSVHATLIKSKDQVERFEAFIFNLHTQLFSFKDIAL
jgi:hypothetical protein